MLSNSWILGASPRMTACVNEYSIGGIKAALGMHFYWIATLRGKPLRSQ